MRPYCHLLGDESVALIDVRSVYREDSRRVTSSVCIPAESIRSRWQEFPPRCTPFALLVDSSPACRWIVDALLAADVMKLDLRAVLHEKDEVFWSSIPARLISTHPEQSLNACVRLWKPGMLAEKLASYWHFWGLPSHGSRAALLDVGCGQGRNAVYLLQELGESSDVSASGHWLMRGVPIDVVALDKRRHLAVRTASFSATVTDALVLLEGQVVAASKNNSQQSLYALTAMADDFILSALTEARICPIYLFDVVLFARNTVKRCFANSVSLLCARAASRRGGAFLAVESFHASASHPEKASQKLAEGELADIVKRQLDTRLWGVDTVMESLVFSEDQRPMLLTVVRVFKLETTS